MKNAGSLAVVNLVMISLLFSSCSVVTGIFKAGMGFGIFLVVAIIILVVVMVMRSKKN